MASFKAWPVKRRKFLAAVTSSTAGLLVTRLAAAAGQCSATPATEDGPLYPAEDIPWANDLTQVPGQSGIAAGEIAYLHGRVVDVDCKPVTDAIVEIWQADSRGYYKHPRHSAPEGLDPNFRYFAKVRADAEGRYALKTIVPKWYRIFDIERAAHVHIKVRSPSNGVLTSEVYFSGAEQDALRARDPVFQSRRSKEQLIVDRQAQDDADIAFELNRSPEERAVYCNFDLAYRL